MSNAGSSGAELLEELTVLRRRVADLEAARAAREQTEECEKFRAFVEAANEWLWAIDLEGRHTFCNAALKTILGYSPEEFLGKSSFDYIHPEDRQRVQEMMKEKTAGREGWTAFVVRWRHRDGSYRFLESTAVPILDCQKTLLGFRGADRDITERINAEKALRESEARFRALVEMTSDWIWEVDARGIYTYVSPKITDLLGYDPEDVMGKSPFYFMPPDEAGRIASIFADLMAAAKPFAGLVNVNRRKDGKVVVLETGAVPLFDAGGKLRGYRGIDRDITERKRAEEALRESEERYRSLVEISPDAIVLSELNGTILFANPAAVLMAGMERAEDLIGADSFELFAEEDRVRARRLARLTVDGLKTKQAEFAFLRRDGSRLIGELTSQVLKDTSGKPHAFLSVIRDVSERKLAEEERRRLGEQVQQAQKLESLGVLAGGIAHDFNNLLTVILGHANLAQLALSPESQAQQDLHEIEAASLRAAELCRQMLAYAGRGRFVLKPVDLSLLVLEMSQLLQVSIPKRVAVCSNLAENLPPVEADPAQMRQVVMNLVSNAAEAIGDGEGTITVSTGVMHCNEAYLVASCAVPPPPPGLYVYIDVADTGHGMDARTKDKIFEPFFTTRFPGRGLGLPAVLGIVRSCRGAIRVESEPDRGAVFRVLFPAAKDKSGEEAGGVTGTECCSGIVLVVDDEATVRDVARQILEGCGFRVLSASDGREAVRLFQEHAGEIVCVLLDLTMPQMDGEDTCRELRRIRDDVRVILASGFGEEEIARRFAGRKPAGFIEKPYPAAALVAKVRAVLGGGDR